MFHDVDITQITGKILQWVCSITGGILLGADVAISFFAPCAIVIGFDIYSAHCLGRRVHKKHPERADGKFKSKYIRRVLGTMMMVFFAIIAADHVDRRIFTESHQAVNTVVISFLIYEVISILENSSSANPSKWALLLQKILVDKAHRHLNIDISDIINLKPNDTRTEEQQPREHSQERNEVPGRDRE